MSFEKQLIDTSVWINLFGKEKGAIPRVISEPIACCHLSLDKRLHVAISDLRGGGILYRMLRKGFTPSYGVGNSLTRINC